MSKNKFTLYRYTHIKAVAIFSAVLVLVGLISLAQYGIASVFH